MFLAGFLAPRASWLLGVIIGLLAAACYTFLILTVFSAVTIVAPAPGLTQDIITSAFVLSPVMGAFFAAASGQRRLVDALEAEPRERPSGLLPALAAADPRRAALRPWAADQPRRRIPAWPIWRTGAAGRRGR